MPNWKVLSRIRELSKRVQAIDRSIIHASPFFQAPFYRIERANDPFWYPL